MFFIFSGLVLGRLGKRALLTELSKKHFDVISSKYKTFFLYLSKNRITNWNYSICLNIFCIGLRPF